MRGDILGRVKAACVFVPVWLVLALMNVTIGVVWGCRRFHVDAIRARLVCTYRGAGTQYVMFANGAPPSRAFQGPTGTPIQLRGTLWSY